MMIIATTNSTHCAIEDGGEVVLTGGLLDKWTSRVTRYNMQGQATTLPSLNTGRRVHVCGTIKNSDGATVRGSWWLFFIDHHYAVLYCVRRVQCEEEALLDIYGDSEEGRRHLLAYSSKLALWH